MKPDSLGAPTITRSEHYEARRAYRFALLSGICALLAVSANTNAVIFVQYPIATSVGSDVPLAATGVNPNISTSDLTLVGATPIHTGLGAGGFVGTDWGLASLDTGKYFEFSLTPH